MTVGDRFVQRIDDRCGLQDGLAVGCEPPGFLGLRVGEGGHQSQLAQSEITHHP